MLTLVSLSVSFLAGKLMEVLIQTAPKEVVKDITPEDILCVKVAGLCHDLGEYQLVCAGIHLQQILQSGHGPYSHLFETRFAHPLAVSHT